MSSRLRIGIIVAVIGVILIVLGGVAVVRLYQQAQQPVEPEEVVQDVVLVDVVVASRDLQVGALVTNEDLRLSQIPVEYTTRDTISTIEEAAGKILKVDVIAGEMILLHNLADPTNVTSDVAYILSETHVLFAFPPPDLMSREAIIKTGDIVDIYVTMQTTIETIEEDDTRTETTETVTWDAMQRVDITAMVVDIITEEGSVTAEGSEEADQAPRRQRVIQAYLLAMDPQDALILKYLKDQGAVFDLVLRAPTSTGQFNLTPVTSEYLRELYGLEILP